MGPTYILRKFKKPINRLSMCPSLVLLKGAQSDKYGTELSYLATGKEFQGDPKSRIFIYLFVKTV